MPANEPCVKNGSSKPLFRGDPDSVSNVLDPEEDAAMKVLLLTLAALVLLAAFGCGHDQGTAPAPLSGEPTSDLQRAGPPPLFYTSFWPAPYGMDALQLIDTRTGLGSEVVQFNIPPEPGWPSWYAMYGETFDLDGTLYGLISWFDGVAADSRARLCRIDMGTGDLTYIGQPYMINFAGPDIDHYGNLYATGFTVGDPATHGDPPIVIGDSYLYRFNKATGVATRIGDTGRTDWMDLAFDSQNRCWATTKNALWILDTSDGHATFMTAIHGVPQDNIPHSCPADWPYMEVMSIAFDEGDNLWGAAIRGFSSCDFPELNSPVMKIDVKTGNATLVGYTYTSYGHGGDILPTKVTVAHREANGRYNLISISLSGLAAHLAHGDYVPGTVGDPAYPH
jgi:hypothetical protein